MSDIFSSEKFNTHTVRGGRFVQAAHSVMNAVNASVAFDQKLWAQDIAASKAHATMLAQCCIITQDDNAEIQHGLDIIQQEIANQKFVFSDTLEDVHMNIEHQLQQRIGDAAGRLHTARSRNDQVAVDFRLWVRDAIDMLITKLKNYQHALLKIAQIHAETVMPGFTHLQSAQPVTLGHHLLAHAEATERDVGRFQNARTRLNECPLGAAALAGTSFAIDRHATAQMLGFTHPTRNSIDSVSARDFAIEFLSASAICSMHLSRFAEEVVLWMTPQFNFIGLSDAWTTGSSIMPQKRNPDAAELVRGKTGRIFGNLIALLSTMKGLPLAYSKDMQEDKERVFDTTDNLGLCIDAMAYMVTDMTVNTHAMERAASQGYAVATDLADRMTQRLNIPFRHAHHLTGRVVRVAEQLGLELHQLTDEHLQQIDKRLNTKICCDLSVYSSVCSRTSFGGTAPQQVRTQIADMTQRIVSREER